MSKCRLTEGDVRHHPCTLEGREAWAAPNAARARRPARGPDSNTQSHCSARGRAPPTLLPWRKRPPARTLGGQRRPPTHDLGNPSERRYLIRPILRYCRRHASIDLFAVAPPLAGPCPFPLRRTETHCFVFCCVWKCDSRALLLQARAAVGSGSPYFGGKASSLAEAFVSSPSARLCPSFLAAQARVPDCHNTFTTASAAPAANSALAARAAGVHK